jgi:hypothetical protein
LVDEAEIGFLYYRRIEQHVVKSEAEGEKEAEKIRETNIEEEEKYQSKVGRG